MAPREPKLFFSMDILVIYLALSFFLIVFTFVMAYKFLGYIYPFLFWGGIYVPTSDSRVKAMIKLLALKPGERFVDLGAGDGRLIIEAGKAGAEAYGYEINPFLVKLVRKKICETGLDKKAFVFQKNLWHQNLRGFDAVAVYPMRHMMKKLERKFEKELKPGAKVVSNYFRLPSWTPVSKEDNIYFYIKE